MIMRPQNFLTATIICMVVAFSSVAAQDVIVTDVPVRYDTDLLPPEFHETRRAAVVEALPSNGVAVLFSAAVRNRDNDVDYEYRQSSDLYYLTGMNEPGSVLVLAPQGVEIDGESTTELLFVPSRDPSHEVWEGRRLGPERAASTLGIAKTVSNERFEEFVGRLSERDGIRFFHQPLPPDVDPSSTLGAQTAAFAAVANPLPSATSGRMASMAANFMFAVEDPARFARMQGFLGRVSPDDFVSPVLREAAVAFAAADSVEEWLAWRRQHVDEVYADGGALTAILGRLRSIKSPEELRLMRHAIDATVAAQREAMRSIEPGMHEYEIEAVIEYVFKKNGAEYPGFPSIVASGENATILHYTTNRRRMETGDMVVMDVGAEYHGYSADVTRTVPVNGEFSPEQRAVYQIVLDAQKAGIRAAQAGAPYGAVHEASSEVLANGLIELGLMTTPEELRKFFMHGTSHYLGLSVHDVGDRGPLLPGTVITVEPGIYIRPSPEVEERWWNIGVRIEDDILVTEDGPVTISAEAPRSIEEIEAIMKERGLGNDQRTMVPRNASF